MVIDASVALAWAMPDEESPYADGIMMRLATEPGHVPSIWALEVANAFVLGVRRGRYDYDRMQRLLASFEVLSIQAHPVDQEDWSRLCSLAHRTGLSVYDSAYLDLAQRLESPLASLDARLLEEATRLGIGRA